uniref:FLZ-type domain-containing protein n=1 Tax=Setaria viridis TaxID=4556 RepID=A0A4U6UL42_SETVI|nr:hypothetical protein SEVIR_5G245850v2 [Setaria viridis]
MVGLATGTILFLYLKLCSECNDYLSRHNIFVGSFKLQRLPNTLIII